MKLWWDAKMFKIGRLHVGYRWLPRYGMYIWQHDYQPSILYICTNKTKIFSIVAFLPHKKQTDVFLKN